MVYLPTYIYDTNQLNVGLCLYTIRGSYGFCYEITSHDSMKVFHPPGFPVMIPPDVFYFPKSRREHGGKHRERRTSDELGWQSILFCWPVG